MVIKTELCEFTEYRVYPGRGQRYVTRDCKVHFFISSKAANLFKNKLKPVKLRWTQTWRRMNKKGKNEEVTRRRTRRVQKIQKAITGLSLEELKTKRAAPKAAPKVKEHKEKAKAATTKSAVAVPQQKVVQKAPAGPKPRIQTARKQ